MRAKILSEHELSRTLERCDPMMAVALLMSHRAGLRACEIAALDWAMVRDASGNLSDVVDLPAIATKGRSGQGRIPVAPDLRAALLKWSALRRHPTSGPVICNARCQRLSADSLRQRLKAAYRRAGLLATSHSGRRTFGTRLARKVNLSGVQAALRHRQPGTTLLYVDPASDEALTAAIHGLS